MSAGPDVAYICDACVFSDRLDDAEILSQVKSGLLVSTCCVYREGFKCHRSSCKGILSHERLCQYKQKGEGEQFHRDI